MVTRSLQLLLAMSLLAGLLGALTGCGSGMSGNVSTVSATASKECIGCHATNSKSISPTSGVRITDQWQLSAHNSVNGAGCLDCHSYAHYHDGATSCRSCHATAHMNNGSSCSQCHGSNSANVADCRSCHANAHKDPNSCNFCHGGAVPIDVAMKNPDFAGKCFQCHTNGKNFRRYSVAARHFNNFTGSGVHPAMYVTINYQRACSACHEPHNPLKGKGAAERKAWAESGHGKVSGLAWTDYDFKTRIDSTGYSCLRCHTATGYSNFLANNWTTPFPSTTWATPGDNGREVLTCRACHVNDSFAVKAAPAFIAPYNSNNNPKTFPNASKSNLCIACHSGRESADTIEAITDFTNVSFKNSHYKAGAALMYMASGFWNYTSSGQVIGSSTRLKTMTPDNVTVPTYGLSGGVSSTHRKLGTTLINGDSHNAAFFVPGVADDNGPCVTCHLNVNGVPARAAHGHSWQIDINAAAQLCIKCHASEIAVGGVANAAALSTFLKEQSAGFTGALGLITNQFQTKYGIKYVANAYPYFYDLTKDPAGKTAVKDWTRGTKNQKLGKRLMGAAFNLNLLTKDPGAFAHARTYVRRLVYDTVDYLDDKTMNYSVSTTAIAYNPTLYGRGAKAYTTSATVGDIAPGTTADMIYLLGYNRSTGAWSTPDRP